MTERVNPELNILLLTDRDWTKAAREQAHELGLPPIHAAGSAREAVALLARGHHPISHLFLQADSAEEFLPELVDMTAGQTNGISLVVLGASERVTSIPGLEATMFVASPTRGWLRRILTSGASEPRGEDPSLPVTEQELKDALVEARIQTRYQPIVQMDDSQPVGLEVLARMEHPERGILQPDLFVPQIEDLGLAWPLTEAVITRAFDDWSRGNLGNFGLTMALNFPLDVLLIPDALTWLESYRKRAGVPADRLVIELTESRPVREIPLLRAAVQTLRDIGYGLAIDDVGPAVRDHRALLDLQFTALKLDKDLVRESRDNPTSMTFLQGTIDAARRNNLTIIAEGVEDEETWQRMRALGVDQAQGFLVARPLPAAAVPLWHRDWCARLGR